MQMSDEERLGEQLLDLYEFAHDMHSYKRIYIYGAGMVGTFVYDYLHSKGLARKVECFLTTEYQEREVKRVPVVKICKDIVDEEGIVLLAAKKHVRDELKKVCELLNIINIREINVLDERNYEYYSTVSEKAYPLELSYWYRKRTGQELDLAQPRTYNEKIQWMKLYGITPLMTRLTDKYTVREWVKEKIGGDYLVPLLGTWDSADEIDEEKLPEKFVLKCNHGCMYNEIVTDKSKVDWKAIKEKFNRYLGENFAFVDGFQMQYKDIKPRIMAEEYMENEDGDLYDYKFWCFNGKVKFVMFLSERRKQLRMNNYDLNWNLLPFTYNYQNTDYNVQKPKSLKRMVKIAEKLAEGFPHVRVDLYQLNDGTIKFGEMTFTSATGTCSWNPVEMDERIGRYLSIGGGQERYRIMIETSSICNAKCSFCPNGKLKRPHKVMSDEVFSTIVKKLKKEHICVDRFILHLNGEPLTDHKLFDRIQRLKSNFPFAGIYFTTNFALADTKKIEAILESGIDQITISINSLDAEEYKALMGLELSRTLKNIDELLSKKIKSNNNLKVRVSMVVRHDNAEMAETIQEKYKDMAEIRLIKLGEWIGYGEKKQEENVTRIECDDLFHQICFLSNGDMALCCFDANGIIGQNINDCSIMDGFNSLIFENNRDVQILKETLIK